MENPGSGSESPLPPQGRKRAVILVAVIALLIAGGIAAFLFSPELWGGKPAVVPDGPKIMDTGDLLAGFSKLVLPADQIEDNFTLVPEAADRTGVKGDEAYILKSRVDITIAQVKENLTIQPAAALEITAKGEREWRVKPVQEFAPDQTVKIALAASYLDQAGEPQAREYAWAFQVKDNFKVVRTIPANAATYVPVDTGIEIVFSHEGIKDYERHFSIIPAVAGRFEVHGRTLVFVPGQPLAFRQLYTVKVSAGLGIEGSAQTLAAAREFTFETAADRNEGNKWNGVYRRLIETDTKQAPIIELSSYQVPGSVKAELFRFADRAAYLAALKELDRLPWWSYSKENYRLDTGRLAKHGSFDLPVSESDSGHYAVFPAALDRGYYLAEISAKGSSAQILIQVSDLSIYYNITKTRTIVWANNIGTGRPEAGVAVGVSGTAVSAQTGTDGVAIFDTPTELLDKAFDRENDERYYLTVGNGRDDLVLPASPINRNFWWDSPALADDYWIYLYSDRPRYQTNDTIKYWGLVKGRDGQPVANAKLSLEKLGYVDYYYQPVSISEQALAMEADGFFTGEIAVKDLKPDYYSLILEVDGQVVRSKYLEIDPYVKPAFSLSLEPDRTVAYVGEAVNFTVKANFFEGTPVPDMRLIYDGPDGKKTLITDEYGKAALSYTEGYEACVQEHGCWPEYRSFTVRPEESELAEIRADATVRFYGPEVYATVENVYARAGEAEVRFKSFYFDLVKLAKDDWWERRTDDKPAAGIRIDAEVHKITFTRKETGTSYDFINKKSYQNYEYVRHETKVRDLAFTTDVQGGYTFKQTVEPETAYRIKYRILDGRDRYDRGITYLYHFNGRSLNQYNSWSYNYYHFDLEGEGGPYSIGDDVSAVMLNNDDPLPERERGFLYLQLNNGLEEHRVADNSRYEFRFAADDIPNVAVTGVYFTGNHYEIAEMDQYGESVSFAVDDRRLKIEIGTDRTSYRPGERAVIDIRVTDEGGRPVRANVNLNLVDEAYYAVAEDLATPLETLYSPVRSGSLLARTTHESLRNSADGAEKGGCFAAGTPVLLADGSSKPIEKMKTGDRILTFGDPLGRRTTTGLVTEVWQHRVDRYLIINDTLKVTPEHQMYSRYRFIDAGLLKIGDWLMDRDGRKVFIHSIEIVNEPVEVYNLRIDPQHTYFAGGFYVHNQEKGGGAREFFVDAALFRTLKTDRNGRASVDLTLPDNVTAWRITAQAISDELYAGVGVAALPVTLPVFAEVTIGNEYLSADRPIARIRAFGTALTAGDTAEFSLESATLRFNAAQSLTALAFKPVYQPLPELTVGRHEIVYRLESGKGNDAVKLPLNVVDSRLATVKVESRRLAVGALPAAPNGRPFDAVLTDIVRSRTYGPLTALSWSWGDRLDRKYSRFFARQLLNEHFPEDLPEADLKADLYQAQSGGLTLLPYSSEDIELSVKVALLGAERFDREAMAQYFFNTLESTEVSREEASLALAGLAALGREVLPRLDAWLERDDLSVKERLILALALYRSGAAEASRTQFRSVMNRQAIVKAPQVAVNDEGGPDAIFQATALGAALGAALDSEQAEGMYEYLAANQKLRGPRQNSENLYDLEKLIYLKESLQHKQPVRSRVVLERSGKKETIDLSKENSHILRLTPEEAAAARVLSVEGEVGISLRYADELDAQAAGRDPSIGIRREYFVNGAPAAAFSEKDLVEVRLYPSFDPSALAGLYQVSDLLPSGLAPLTRLYSPNGEHDCRTWYPYQTNGQAVGFMISRDWMDNYCGGDYFRYFARPKNRGAYAAEPAVIQSFINPEYLNLSTVRTITVTQ